MTSYQVTILDAGRQILRQFEIVGTQRDAQRAGNWAADSDPKAVFVTTERI